MVLGAGPRWADQLKRSNEATKTTPQKTMIFSVSNSTRVDALEGVLAIAAIYDLQRRLQGLRPVWH
jgi:hypothetical protein